MAETPDGDGRAAPQGSKVIDVGALIDRGPWSGYQFKLVTLTALTLVFDGVDLQLIGVALPAIMADWGVARGAFAPILAAGLVGMMAGAAGMGVLGDTYGRRRAIIGSVAIFAVATIAMAFVNNPLTFGILRFIVGFGVGGALPNASALAAEYVPARNRAMAVTVAIVCVPLGGVLAGLLAVTVLPTFGWRALFVVGGAIPLLYIFVLYAMLVESPRYLARRPERWSELRRFLARLGQATSETVTFGDPAEAAPVRASTAALLIPEYRRDTLALWCAFGSCLISVYLGFNWIPAMLTSAGLSPTIGSTGVTMFNFGGVVGALSGALAFSRWGSRVTMLTMSAGAALGATALGLLRIGPETSVLLTMLLLAITGGLINAVQTTLYALAAQVYPDAVRSTGVGSASAIGRLGAILSSYLGAWTLEGGGSTLFFGVVAGAMLLTAAALSVVSRHIRPAAPAS